MASTPCKNYGEYTLVEFSYPMITPRAESPQIPPAQRAAQRITGKHQGTDLANMADNVLHTAT